MVPNIISAPIIICSCFIVRRTEKVTVSLFTIDFLIFFSCTRLGILYFLENADLFTSFAVLPNFGFRH